MGYFFLCLVTSRLRLCTLGIGYIIVSMIWLNGFTINRPTIYNFTLLGKNFIPLDPCFLGEYSIATRRKIPPALKYISVLIYCTENKPL